MLKFWTVQNAEILNIIKEEGAFYPNFQYSKYLQTIPELSKLYSLTLEAFNLVNKTNLNGLVFAFAGSDNNAIFSFRDIYDFYDSINNAKVALLCLWKKLALQGNVILELEYTEPFNPLFIDLNDFQFLMPPIIYMPPYTEEYLDILLENFYKGLIAPSVLPSNIAQAHLPYIKAKNIVNVYPMFLLKE